MEKKDDGYNKEHQEEKEVKIKGKEDIKKPLLHKEIIETIYIFLFSYLCVLLVSCFLVVWFLVSLYLSF